MFCALGYVGFQEVSAEGEGKNQIGMDMYTFCQALGPKEVRGGVHMLHVSQSCYGVNS